MRAQDSRRLSRRALSGLAIGAVWFLLAAPDLLFAVNSLSRDTALTYLPLRTYFASRIRRGELPGWFPHIGLGEPYIGRVVTAEFHPQSLLYLFLSPLVALKWTIAFCLLAGLVGAYRFARSMGGSRAASFGAGAGYAIGGYSLSMINNLPYLCGVATFPWVAWAAVGFLRKRRGHHLALLAFFWSMIVLGGDPQTAVLTGLVLLALWAVVAGDWRALPGMAIAGVGAVLVSGVELGPALAFNRDSFRATMKGNAEFALQWPLQTWRLPDLIAPCSVHNEFLSHLSYNGWSRSVYLGSLVVFAAVCGLLVRERRSLRRTLAFGGLGLLAVWMATGESGRLMVFLIRVIPTLGTFRFAAKYLVLLSLSIVPLSAAGFDWLERNARRGAFLAGGAGIVVFSLAVLGGWTGITRSLAGLLAQGQVADVLADAWSSGFRSAAAMLLAAAALVFTARAVGWSVAPVFPALAVVELLRAGAGIFPSVPDSVFREPSPLAAPIRAAAQPPGPPPRLAQDAAPRIDFSIAHPEEQSLRAYRRALFPFEGVTFGLDQFEGDLSTARYAAVLGVSSSAAINAAPWFNGCFVLLTGPGSPPQGSVEVATDKEFGFDLYRRPCVPRASLTGALSAPDQAAALDIFERGLPFGTIVWEGAAPRAPVRGTVQWIEAAPEHLVLDVTADGPAALYVADAYATGWTAAIDGQPATIHPANVAARGIEVPAGHHVVTMQYRVPYLLQGALATLTGLLLLLGLCLLPRRLGWRLFGGTDTAPAG